MKKLSKNLIIITLTAAIAGFVSVGSVLAATDFSISLPQGTEYEPGNTFTANINISPDEKIYTAGIQLSYPANLLKVNSFEFASGWMALTQAGYDSIDNTEGLLIKTAGRGGGIDSFKKLGTVTFETLNKGEATIQLTSDSLALGAGNTNVAGSLDSSQVTIAAAEIIPAEEEEEVPVEEEVTPEEETIPEEEEAVTAPEEELDPRLFVAVIGDVLSLGTGNNWIAVAVLVVIAIAVLVIAYISQRRRRRKKQSPKDNKKG